MTTDPQTPVEELEGRELDAAVAKAVFGKCTLIGCGGMPTYEFQGPPDSGDDTRLCSHYGNEVWQGLGEPPPQFSTDIAAAWEVKRELEGRGFGLTVIGPRGVYGGTFRRDDRVGVVLSLPKDSGGRSAMPTVRADTAPLAICRAALRAVRE